MNTQSVRSSTGLPIVGSLDADYAELARAGRALQGRAIREAIVGVLRWFGAGSHHAPANPRHRPPLDAGRLIERCNI